MWQTSILKLLITHDPQNYFSYYDSTGIVTSGLFHVFFDPDNIPGDGKFIVIRLTFLRYITFFTYLVVSFFQLFPSLMTRQGIEHTATVSML